MGRPVGTNVFKAPPPEIVVTGEKPFEKPPRTNVFKTPPSGEIVSIPNNTTFEKPPRVTVFQPAPETDDNWWDSLIDIFSPTNGQNGGGLIPEASAEEETPALDYGTDLESRIAQLERVQQTYPQLPSASQKSDLDIWNHLNQWVWGKSGAESSPVGTWEVEPTAIRNIQKAQTIEYKQLHEDQRVQLSDALEHREKLSDKIETNIDKIRTHKHDNGGGGECDCEFWDIGCKFKCGLEGLGKVVLIAGVGIIIFYAFKKGLIGRAVGKIR